MTSSPNLHSSRVKADRAKTPGVIMLWVSFGVIVFLCLSAVRRFAAADHAIGDFQHYYYAAKAVTEGADIYRQLYNSYGYLPMLAIALAPLVPLGPTYAAAVWTLLCGASMLLAAWLGGREVMRRLGLSLEPSAMGPVLLITTIVMADKIRLDFRLGQTDAPIYLGFILGLCWLGKRPALSGWCMGFIANFKYQSLGFLPYFLVRRRWSAAAWSVISSVLLAWSGVLIWGWETNQRYVSNALGAMVKMLGAKGQLSADDGAALYPLGWFRSVSIPSTLARAAESLGLPDKAAVLVTGVLAAGAFALGWWLYRRFGRNLFVGRAGRADDSNPAGGALLLLEWAGILVASLVFSPQATARHFFPMYLPVTIAAALMLNMRDRRAQIALSVALAVFLLTLILPPGQGDEVPNAFRAWGMPSWGAMVLYFTTLWAGLRHIQGMPGEPANAAPVAARAGASDAS